MKELLFVYGTLLLPEVQKSIIGRFVSTEADVLQGYKKEPVVIGNNEYFTLVPDEYSSIEGAVISVTEVELNRIDDYETPEYKRISVEVESGSVVWVYVKS